MNFEFIPYTPKDADLWDQINIQSPNSSFITSLPWIDFQLKRGKEIKQFLIKTQESIQGIIYIEIYRRRTAKFAYAPYNPVLRLELEDNDLLSLYSELHTFSLSFIKQQKLHLFRFDPLVLINKREILMQAGFVKSFASAQAQDVWEMTLPNELEVTGESLSSHLLSAIKKDTRYYINRAIKSSVTVKKAISKKDVLAFGELMNETTQRKRFTNFDSDYYLEQWMALHDTGITEIYLAEYKGKYVAGALMNFHKDTVYYAHGASSSDPEAMKISAPYALHFEIMKDVYKRGIKKYNFWGVVPKSIKHEYRGLSDFKMKFPGEMQSYVGPYELGLKTTGYYIQRLADLWNYRKERYNR